MAVVKVDIGDQHLRRVDGLLDEAHQKDHAIEFENAAASKPASFAFRNLSRDPADRAHSVRLFLQDGPSRERASLVIPGLDIATLYDEAEDGNPWGPMSLARVFTGEDGKASYRRTPFKLPFGFYLEWAYVKNGRGIYLSSLEKRNPDGSYTALPDRITRVHAANLALWYVGEHRPKVDASATYKPCMEGVYRKAKCFNRKIDGPALFGATVWDQLRENHHKIMAVKEALRY
jgi:hypothetical protein